MAQAIILMGVSGSGKTTIGERLGQALGWPYYDADDFHPPENVERMRHGIALTDEDRKPWLAALARLIVEALSRNQSILLGCSALKKAYREQLKPPADDLPEVVPVQAVPAVASFQADADHPRCFEDVEVPRGSRPAVGEALGEIARGQLGSVVR